MTLKPVPQSVFDVCKLLSEGLSVQKGCAELGISTGTFYEWLRNSELVEKEYARAREARADVRFEKLQDLLDDINAKKIEPNAARVILDAIKWQCGKEKAKVYGDSTYLRGDKDNPIEISLAGVLDAAMSKRQAIQAPMDITGECIDVTPISDNDKAKQFI